MNILDMLAEKLNADTPNVLGNRYAKINIDGDVYSVIESTASSRHNCDTWTRTDYKMNGKKIAKCELAGGRGK